MIHRYLRSNGCTRYDGKTLCCVPHLFEALQKGTSRIPSRRQEIERGLKEACLPFPRLGRDLFLAFPLISASPVFFADVCIPDVVDGVHADGPIRKNDRFPSIDAPQFPNSSFFWL